jgi:nucleoside-diphosphate-sugar epimerase
MTILVTGGGGFLGSQVIAGLRSRGVPVRAFVRPRGAATVRALGAEVVEGDVTDRAAWRRATPGTRAIVHAAAFVTRRRPLEEYIDVNVGGTRLAVEAARAGGQRLVHVSSVAVYGRPALPAADRAPVDEAAPFLALPEADFYARSKRLAEQVVQEAAERHGFTAVAIRPDVIYGEGDRLFTPKLIRALGFGLVPLVGGGTNRLACVYVGNVVAAVAAALDAPIDGFRAYNVTHDAPPDLTLREFVDAFGAELGVRLRHVHVSTAVARLGAGVWTGVQRMLDRDAYAGLGHAAVAFLTRDNPYVTDRVARELGWRPPFDTRSAIRRTVRWYRERGA